VTAELPAHFAESLAMIGFDASAGDLPPRAPPKQLAPRVAKPSNRRGERRSRSAPAKGKRK